MNSKVQAEHRQYPLCRWCADRQGEAGKTLPLVKGKECWICGGAVDQAPRMAAAAAGKARRYQFKTFSVGVSFPDGVQEREDELRSDLKLKGNETIKTQAARLVATQLSSVLGKKVDKRRPDLALLVDFGTGGVTANSKPVFFYGRYAKPSGISQKRPRCTYCQGRGCQKCHGTGLGQEPSVEELLWSRLGKLAGSDKVTLTWLGSEDRESRVYPPGRPFVAEIKNPRKRKLPPKFGTRFRGGLVSVVMGRVLPSKPTHLPSFRFTTRIKATAASKVDPGRLAQLSSALGGTIVRFERPNNRPTMKRVYRVALRARGSKMTIDAELDGGLPVKRFVSGELVSPSVSEVLKTEVGCRSFDIRRVKEIGGFKFAEVARGKAKN